MLAGLELILRGTQAERILLIGGGSKSAGWRQLLADATGAIIQVPEEEEAGCLGAAIQAMYASGHTAGEGVTFEALAEQYVRVDEAKTAQPDASKHGAYRAAMEAYRRELGRLYPETAKQG